MHPKLLHFFEYFYSTDIVLCALVILYRKCTIFLNLYIKYTAVTIYLSVLQFDELFYVGV
jgi:hypothetical protein